MEKGKFKYMGYWGANNGSTFCLDAYESNNKRKLEKDLREICSGNIYEGQKGYISIFDNCGRMVLEKEIR